MRKQLRRPAGLLLTAKLCLLVLTAIPAMAQVDQELAQKYFEEAEELCQREGGRLWGRSLYGPMVVADAKTRTTATNQPAPDEAPPRHLGYANAPVKWGDDRWTMFVWQAIPSDDQQARGRLMLHELFHRIQPELGLMTPDGQNEHLDTPEGRYWLQLEWRALAAALGASGEDRRAAIRDALAFRAARRGLFPDAGANEQLDEIREGLAQYTGTVAAAPSPEAATADAIEQLGRYATMPSFVRTFAYPSGAAYGILLDEYAPGWTRRITSADGLGELLMRAADVRPADDAANAAARYGGAELREAEQLRDAEQQARIAELRRRFIDGPVLVVPGAPGSFVTTGVTAIPGVGTVYPSVRVIAEWGSLQADQALRSPDQSTITLPAPDALEGTTLTGDGWTLELAPGWVVRLGPRPGDARVARGDR